MQDTELVQRTLQGDNDSFGRLVSKYQGVVYGLCFHLVGNFTDAQDLAQEAFVLAYRNLYQLREPSKFASWLHSVTVNVCRMWLRKQKFDVISLDTKAATKLTSALPTQQEIVEEKELQLAVRQAIDSLSEKNRLAVMLYYIDGLSYQKISDFWSVPVTTVKSRLTRARLQLKEELMTMVEKNFGEHKLPEDFVEKVKKVIPGKTTSQQVIEVFGKPDRYSYWKEGAVPEEALPDSMDYDEAGVSFAMYGRDTVGEVRIESNKDYSYEGEIGLGSSLEDVISFFGEPSETVTGEPIGWQDKVLYKNIKGETGYCYIHYKDIGIRIFLVDYRVRAIYLCIPDTTP